MGGSTPDWADPDDYADLEEVFTSRAFGRPLPETAAAIPVTSVVAFPKPDLDHNRAISLLSPRRRPGSRSSHS